MTGGPGFSIVLATYGRGRHIAPTIASVLGQTIADFELIVVGDGCSDDTQAAVAAFADARVAWCNLPHNTGSQSLPNNEGIRRARGTWVCYIGHDDIWAPDHLQAIRQTIDAHGAADVVVSGCIYHGPPGSGVYIVKGLFDAPDAALRHFCPPSLLAHRRDAALRIGGWRDPRAIKPPVDADFLLRAARAGLRFVSTARITVHKFAAGHRYLSYLRPGSDEQTAMLRAIAQNSVALDDVVAISRRSGLFMTGAYPDFEKLAVGSMSNRTGRTRGSAARRSSRCPVASSSNRPASGRARLVSAGIQGQAVSLVRPQSAAENSHSLHRRPCAHRHRDRLDGACRKDRRPDALGGGSAGRLCGFATGAAAGRDRCRDRPQA
jgi:glycosyltransferase involved in cell wall biosynthesis